MHGKREAKDTRTDCKGDYQLVAANREEHSPQAGWVLLKADGYAVEDGMSGEGDDHNEPLDEANGSRLQVLGLGMTRRLEVSGREDEGIAAVGRRERRMTDRQIFDR